MGFTESRVFTGFRFDGGGGEEGGGVKKEEKGD